MTIADPSLTRRLRLLEQQVAALERSLSQARQATASYVAPRERWLGRVATSPTPAATDDTYLVDLLGATFEASPGQRDLVEHPRGVSVVARTWPARALSAGDEVIVERIRGGLAGDADAGEWWIGLDPPVDAGLPYALFEQPRLVVAHSDATDHLRGREASGTIYYETVRMRGAPRVSALGNGAATAPDGYVCSLDDPLGAYCVITWQAVTLGEGLPARWRNHATLSPRPYDVVYPHVHDLLLPDQSWIRASVRIVADSGPGHLMSGPTNHGDAAAAEIRGQYTRANVNAVARIGVSISHETAHGYDEQRPDAATIVGDGQMMVIYLGRRADQQWA